MEIVLLWLDDLDDLLFTGVVVWERIRQYCLSIGLAASLALCATQWWGLAVAEALVFVSASSVVVWLLGSLACLYFDAPIRPTAQTA